MKKLEIILNDPSVLEKLFIDGKDIFYNEDFKVAKSDFTSGDIVATGSTAHVIDVNKYYVLGASREWEELEEPLTKTDYEFYTVQDFNNLLILKPGDIVTVKSSEDGSVIYYKLTSNFGLEIYNSRIRISHNTELQRPIYFSELYNKLSERRWGIVMRRYVKDGVLFQQADSLEEMSTDYNLDDQQRYLVDSSRVTGWQISQPIIRDSIITEFKNDFKREIEMMESSSVILYNSSRLTVDLLNDSITYDLLGTSDYTNLVSLVGVEKKYIREGVAARVTVTVQYTKADGIYSKDLSFEAFCYESGTALKRNNFIGNINNSDVLVEYVDGIVRAIPNNEEVNECIISNCLITYGNL